MRRRSLLAALATSFIGATAGCGYAYGGGDVRHSGSVGAGGFRASGYALGDDRIVAARSGTIVDHDVGGFVDGTRVTVTSRTGERLWQYVHDAESVAVSASDPVYLLDEKGDVVALAATRSEDDRAGGASRYEGTELWKASPDGPRPPVAGDNRGAYVAAVNGLIAVRDGDVAWRVDLDSNVESVFTAGETILVTTGVGVSALTPSGSVRWRVETDDPKLAIGGQTVGVRDGPRITARELASGDELWTAETDDPGGQLAIAEDRLYATDRNGVRAFDAATGDLEWHTGMPIGLKTPLVAGPEAIYGVRGRCRTVAVDENGTRWTREVSVRECSPVGGWIDGERVAFLFESGELLWLQRADQNRGLL